MLAKALKGRPHRGIWQVLIALHGLPESNATWEVVGEFRRLFPASQLEDKLFPQDEGRVQPQLHIHAQGEEAAA